MWVSAAYLSLSVLVGLGVVGGRPGPHFGQRAFHYPDLYVIGNFHHHFAVVFHFRYLADNSTSGNDHVAAAHIFDGQPKLFRTLLLGTNGEKIEDGHDGHHGNEKSVGIHQWCSENPGRIAPARARTIAAGPPFATVERYMASAVGREKKPRVDRRYATSNFEVELRPIDSTRRPGGADYPTLLHNLAHRDHNVLSMGIGRHVGATMRYEDQIAVPAQCSGVAYRPVGRGTKRRAAFRSDIDSFVAGTKRAGTKG